MSWLEELLAWFEEYGPWLLELAGHHLLLSFLAMFIACAMAVPLGIALAHTHLRRLANGVINVVGVVQPVPSLALVALASVLFVAAGLPSLGLWPALVALVAYALLPILRNTYTGIRQVDPAVIEVATGMGMRPKQILYRVELPLALPFIMAGIRISTVWTIGIATLASLIGAESLGKPIFQGISGDRKDLILGGALSSIALALMFQWILGKLEDALTPAGLERSQPRAQ
jgi:osmoprotectant transport system permease protein